MRVGKGKSVLWAVDPFEVNLKLQSYQVRGIVESAQRAGLRLIPVFVLTVTEKQWANGELPRLPETQAALDRYLGRYPLAETMRARVIMDQGGSRLGAVRALLDFAGAEDAEWITLSSHGRGGVQRLLLGSFAETLLEQSPLPVFFLPRLTAGVDAPASRTVLFPTDLSRAAHVAFTRFLDVAASQRFEVAIHHALSSPVPLTDFGVGPIGLGPMLPENYVREETNRAHALGSRLVEEAAHRGVKARFVLEEGLVAAVTGRTVLEAAQRERARMIAMPSFSGPVTRILLGSVAQDVFRAGRMPVWLYGPRSIGEERTKAA